MIETVEAPARTRAAASSPRPAVVALAVTEAREMLLHPVLLAFGAMSLLFMGLAAGGFGENNTGTDEALVLVFVSGFAVLPLGVGCFVAANLCALRPRRHRTAELFEPAPLSPAARTVALMLATLGPGALALALTATAILLGGTPNGVSIEFPDGRRLVAPTLAELAQGPLVVVMLGILGIAFARWVPRAQVGILAVLGAVPQMIAVSWLMQGPKWWLAPMVNDLRVHHWNDVSPSYSYPVISRLASDALAWHLVYIAGIGLLAAGVALVPKRAHGVGNRRAPQALAVVGVAVAVAGGIVQTVVLGG